MEPWEFAQYEQAAVQLCMQLKIHPYEFTSESSYSRPRWHEYAGKMNELSLTIRAMRDYGIIN